MAVTYPFKGRQDSQAPGTVPCAELIDSPYLTVRRHGGEYIISAVDCRLHPPGVFQTTADKASQIEYPALFALGLDYVK